ncbi:non-canonical purine NTP diphosphatase [Lutimonas zeaxanthinifaciens]|uniref:non-canonical purine NTP diphosphatase n=1 Tax=Lutimonas zeaxanthinifaciens TaxID=3060215 RepID=UPI00265D4C49|nr:non-canonical purine NTP diphosphatase [Lutimonas sp. YSD2104]WKK67431.1 non-canonical purine NTP diphosphatase [Lutimonas sp. YSD2104]
MKIVFATNNKHKVKEIKDLLPSGIQVMTLDEIGCNEEIEETAATLEGNAKIKSDHVKEEYGYDCFADDTGLEVEVLEGAPGVYSARYAGENATFEENVNKLLDALEGQSNRKARFRTVISLNINGEQQYFEGVCNGEIELSAKGSQGFGYDPVFKPDGYDQTFAEMDLSTKGRISHRGRAVQKLVEFLKKKA